MNDIRRRLEGACQKVLDEGGKIVASPAGIDGEYCPMQAVCMEKVGGFGLMWYPWFQGPMHELGITREQVWNFIAGFDGKELSAYQYTSKTFEDEDFYQLGKDLRSQFYPEIR